jgi:hypothetical protein
MLYHLRQKFIDHNALVVNALQPRDFERQYFAEGEKATFCIAPHPCIYDDKLNLRTLGNTNKYTNMMRLCCFMNK